MRTINASGAWPFVLCVQPKYSTERQDKHDDTTCTGRKIQQDFEYPLYLERFIFDLKNSTVLSLGEIWVG